jgi:hypothetical protein
MEFNYPVGSISLYDFYIDTDDYVDFVKKSLSLLNPTTTLLLSRPNVF